MNAMSVLSINNDANLAMAQACEVLASGNLVALPTETVYGLAADATNGVAVARIFETKGRPHFNPLICHMSGIGMARHYVIFDRLALQLAEAFWPGPMTLVQPKKPDTKIHALTSAGLDTLAVRVPTGFSRQLIEAYGRPLAAPSANTSGKVSSTTAHHVALDLGSKIPLILDAGPAAIGLESTILKPTSKGVELLRPGGLSVEEVEAVLGAPIIRKQQSSAAIEAPGMMRSHYAPAASVHINASRICAGDAVITFGGQRLQNDAQAAARLDLSESGNLQEAAANLFDFLKVADAATNGAICVAPVPANGLGEAINDRLHRAAAPRPQSL